MRLGLLLFTLAAMAMGHPSWGLIVEADGTIFFTDVVANEVYRLSRDGRRQTLKTGVHSHFLHERNGVLYGEHLWYDPGRDQFHSYPFALTAEGRFTRLERHPAGVGELRDRAGRLYRALPNRLERVAANGAVTVLGGVPFAGVARGALARMNGLALDEHDNLYVADIEYGVVRRVTPGGQVETVHASGVNWSPWGVAWRGGDLYVLEQRAVPAGTRIIRRGADARATVVYGR